MKELVDYISRHLKKGIPLPKIKKELLEAGHPIRAIEEASFQVANEEPQLASKSIAMKACRMFALSCSTAYR